MRIVVAAEPSFTRSTICVNLRFYEYEVTEIEPTCLLDVIEVLREVVPNLIVLEYEIPRCYCETVVRTIREDPILFWIPLLIVVESWEVAAIERMNHWTGVRFLVKPFQIANLHQAVELNELVEGQDARPQTNEMVNISMATMNR